MRTEEPTPDPLNFNALLSRFISAGSLHKIKFGRGVVGKLAWIVIIAIAGISYICRSVDARIVLSALGMIGFLCTAALAAIVIIVIKRPELAVTEGMEVIQLKRLAMAAKDYQPEGELVPVPDPKKSEGKE
jgi:hypothetical protein